MPWGQAVLQWLHVLFGIFWFGSTMYFDFIFSPVLVSLPRSDQKVIGGAVGKRAGMVLTVAGLATVLLGVVRGISAGVLSTLTSAYGLTWLAALLVGLGIIAWGLLVMAPRGMRLGTAAEGPEMDAAVASIRKAGQVEVLMFFVIFGLMIAMRFGY